MEHCPPCCGVLRCRGHFMYIDIDKEKLEQWKKDNGRTAGYAHFDEKFGLHTSWDYVTNPEKVKTHGFFPFITYDQIFYKVSNKNGAITVKDKVRPICYAAHIDRCIYQYYGYLLNEAYNEFTANVDISKSVVAYRTNLHKNNIHFAKQAFDFIKQGDCNIVIGDFKGFFDNLNHTYLKTQLCTVLCVEQLSPDWYAVFKNITKYSTWDLIDILQLNELITDTDIKNRATFHENALAGDTRNARNLMKYFDSKIKELNGFEIENPKERSKKLALTKEQFKKHKKVYLKRNCETFGIPQGSSISAVLSNVYMIDFDQKICEFVENLNGLYLRYSDDFIIVLPKNCNFNLQELVSYLHGIVKETKQLTLEEKKTQTYTCEQNQIFNVNLNNGDKLASHIDYLGFIFDGKEVELRPKTVSKYYYRMYQKLNYIVKSKGVTKNGKQISCKELYKTYTQKGRSGQYDPEQLPKKVIQKNGKNPYASGNFFSYVYKANAIFNPEYTGKNKTKQPKNQKEPITKSTNRHLLKIRRKLDAIDRDI